MRYEKIKRMENKEKQQQNKEKYNREHGIKLK